MRGRQEPRLANLPAFHTSDGAGVGNIIRVAAMEPFPWQNLVYSYVLARDENGKLRTVTMGSYGVGVSRAVACVAEGNHDELGLIWPRALAPADVHVVVTGKDETVATYGEELTRALEARGVAVLLDDRRQASPGVKFKDAELIGVPTIVVIGRGLAQGVIEVKDRRTGERREVAVDAAVQEILAEIGQA